MPHLKRPFSRSAVRTGWLPSSRPVHVWRKWDVVLATRFQPPEAEIARIEQQTLIRFQELAAAGALDSAHAAIFDAFIEEQMAPLFEAAENQFDDGVRVIELLNQQGLEDARIACGTAERLAREAQAAENEASAVYKTHVGLDSVTTNTIAPFDLEKEADRWQRQRLALEADKGILDFDRWGFRRTSEAPSGADLETAADENDQPSSEASPAAARLHRVPPIDPNDSGPDSVVVPN